MHFKNFKRKLNMAFSYALSLFSVFLSGITPVYANDLIAISDTASANVVTTVCSLVNSWFIPVFLISILIYFLTKDDRAKAIEKKVCIGIVVARVLCMNNGSIITSVWETVASWFS